MSALGPVESARPSSASGVRLAMFTDTYPPHVSGAARALARLVCGVRERGGEVQVVTVQDPAAPDDPQVSRLPAEPLWIYPQFRVAAPGTALRLARELIADFRPTVVHAATPFGAGLAARAIARKLRIPLVTSYHTHFTAYLKHYNLRALSMLAWPFLRWFHNSGSATYAPSEHVRTALRQRGFRNLRLWSRGVDSTVFHPRFRSSAIRDSLGASPDQVVVLYVGRLAPEKGIDVALAAVESAMARHPGRIRFVLTGEGPAEAWARSMAPPGTVFTGALSGEALSGVYASADVLVFPSQTETFGNVVLEAMASGLAVVSSHEGPTADFAHAGTALPCDVTSPSAVAACISQLVENAALRESLAESALRAARERSWDSILDRIVDDYADLSGVALAEPAPMLATPAA